MTVSRTHSWDYNTLALGGTTVTLLRMDSMVSGELHEINHEKDLSPGNMKESSTH